LLLLLVPHSKPGPPRAPTTTDPIFNSPAARFLLHPREFLLDLAHRVADLALSVAHRVLVPALVLTALAALTALALAVVRIWNVRRARREARYVEILAPPEADLDGAAQLWSALHDALRPRWRTRLTGRAHVAFELAWSHGGALRLGLWVPGTVALGVVERAVEGAWPGTATHNTADPSAPLPLDHLAVGGELRLGLAEWFALRHDHRNDPLRAVIAAAGDLRDQETACVQVLARPVGVRRLRHAERAVRELRAGNRHGLLRCLLLGLLDLVADPLHSTSSRTTPSTGTAARQDPTVSRDVTAILAKLAARPCWELRVRYGVTAPPPLPAPERAGGPASSRWAGRWAARKRLRGRAHTLASAFGVYTDRNHLVRHRLHRPASALAARRLGRGDLVCLLELVALAHLPTDATVPGLARAGARTVAPPPEIPTRGKTLGDAEADGRRPVALAIADARYHLHLMGKTGAGKSNLITNLVLGDLAAGRGAVVIDPKGDLVCDLLDRLPEQVAQRLVLLDPDERHAPPALNVLDGPDPELAVDHLVGIFRNVFANVWGPRTDDTLRAACLTLLSVPQAQATLADVPRLLMEPAFRQRFTAALHPRSPLGVFWTAYERASGHAQAVMVGPVLARLRAFLMRSFVADVVGSATSSFDMAAVLDGGLLLARLPKGQLGAETSRLLGSSSSPRSGRPPWPAPSAPRALALTPPWRSTSATTT
jgi:hypothetical protein